MNAIIRAKYEVPVLTNEAIEVHLSYLRAGFDSMQLALHALNAKIDKANDERVAGDAALGAKIEAVNTSLSAKIDKANEERAAGDAALGAKIEAFNASLSAKIDKANEERAAGDAALGAKIDKANEERAAGDAALGAKIDKLTEKVLETHANQKALFCVVGLGTLVASGVSIARTLNWI